MIDKIKLLDIQTQGAIVSHIQEVRTGPGFWRFSEGEGLIEGGA